MTAGRYLSAARPCRVGYVFAAVSLTRWRFPVVDEAVDLERVVDAGGRPRPVSPGALGLRYELDRIAAAGYYDTRQLAAGWRPTKRSAERAARRAIDRHERRQARQLAEAAAAEIRVVP